MQWFQRAISVPKPVVHIERARILMHFVIESAVVLPVLADVHHTLITAVKRGVENPFLFRRATFHLNLAEHFIPTSFGAACDLVELPSWNLFLQIFLRLLNADE